MKSCYSAVFSFLKYCVFAFSGDNFFRDINSCQGMPSVLSFDWSGEAPDWMQTELGTLVRKLVPL